MTSAERLTAQTTSAQTTSAQTTTAQTTTAQSMTVQAMTVQTTTDSADKAAALARGAVEARLAACAQIVGPVTSVYHWAGGIETTQEWQVLFKTTTICYPELERHLLAAHDYETPEIIATPVVAGSPAYLSWVTAETTRR